MSATGTSDFSNQGRSVESQGLCVADISEQVIDHASDLDVQLSTKHHSDVSPVHITSGPIMRANDSLTMPTRGAPATSSAEKWRPLRPALDVIR
jgi:hypothetical protein